MWLLRMPSNWEQFFFFHGAGIKFNTNFDMTCSTKMLLYVLTDMGCNEYYVGQTSNTLKEKNKTNKQQALHPDIANCRASRHIAKRPSHLPIPYTIMPF